MTIITQKSLYNVNYLMYGYLNASAEWQQFIDQMIKDIEGCIAFYDDTKISSASAKDHLKRLRQFLKPIANLTCD